MEIWTNFDTNMNFYGQFLMKNIEFYREFSNKNYDLWTNFDENMNFYGPFF